MNRTLIARGVLFAALTLGVGVVFAAGLRGTTLVPLLSGAMAGGEDDQADQAIAADVLHVNQLEPAAEGAVGRVTDATNAGEEDAPKPGPFDRLPRVDIQSRTAVPGDWRSAGPDGLLDEIRAHWVMLSSDGKLTGRIATTPEGSEEIVPAEGLHIYVLDGGRIVGRGTTNAEGRFRIETVVPGVYSLVAMGEKGFLAYALVVLPHAEQAANNIRVGDQVFVNLQQASGELELNTLAIGPTFNTLKRLIKDYYPELKLTHVDEADFVKAIEGELGAEKMAAEGVPPRWYGYRDLMADRPGAKPATSIKTHRVVLNAHGDFVGRLHGIQRLTGRPKMIREVNVFILRNDRIVASTNVDENGVFTVKGLQPGVYGLVAGGQDGFGALGFEAVAAEAADGQAALEDGTTFVAAQPQVPLSFAMALITDPRDLFAAFDADNPQQIPPPPSGLVQNPPGAAGTGSGGTGTGDLMGFVGLSALGVAAAIVASDEDNELATPFRP